MPKNKDVNWKQKQARKADKIQKIIYKTYFPAPNGQALSRKAAEEICGGEKC